MSSVDLGSVTAYSIAVKYGFEGTEAEWMQAILNAGDNAQIAQESAEFAESSAEIASILYGSPLVAHTASEMLESNRVYVYVGSETGYTFGNWYYYNGETWTSGGVYNSEGINTDTTLSVEGMPADAKAVGDELSDVKSDLAELEGGGVPTTVRQALKTLLESAAYADTGLTDEMAVISSWASAVTAITLNQSSISISGATTSQLVATTTPTGGTVTWSSSNTAVATVSSSGLVTGVSNGTATITATSGNVSATCSVTVSGIATLSSISASYTQTGTIYDTDELDDILTAGSLVVTATYSDSSTEIVPSTDYTLSGTLTEGTSTITVSYNGKTTTFAVTVTHNAQEWTDGVPYSFEWVENKYISNTNGQESNYNGWNASPYLNCAGAGHLLIHNGFKSSSGYNGWYDENQTYIDKFTVNSQSASGATTSITVPSNAVYFRVSYDTSGTGGDKTYTITPTEA